LNVLSWNLFHGRSLPGAKRPLLAEFAEQLAGWRWDVALLQEVPPWWAQALAARSRAEQRAALTSRNAALPLRRLLAGRWPDLIKSNGGGCNAILSRAPIAVDRAVRLRRRPERRVAQLVRLADGTCLVNYHASTRVALAEDELARLWRLALEFASGAPLILGGDLNLRSPVAPAAPGPIAHLAARDVDHLFAHGGVATSGAEVLDRHVALDGAARVELSDHPPLRVGVAVDQSLRCSASASP
jgi:endonuclease/exonuclease/phosphatase family metal-dependent hydrolase